MNASTSNTFEVIPANSLLARARALRREGWRLVQIGGTRLPDKFEITYSFDLAMRLIHLRVELAPAGPRLPSITPVYWCAFLYENELHDLFGIQVDNIAVDFQGHLYKTAVKFAFGTTKMPNPKPAAAVIPYPK